MRKFNITVNGKTYEVEVEEVGGIIGGAPGAAPVSPTTAPAPAPAAPAAKPAAPKAAPVAGAAQVKAPMPGTVMSVKVAAGDKVTKDTVVAVLEAMKMENEIFAGVDGTVAGVSVSNGDSVNTGDVLVSIN